MSQDTLDKNLVASLTRARAKTERGAKEHLAFLGKLPGWAFVLAVGAWTVVLKTLLVPFVAFVNDIVLAPLGVTAIYTSRPLLDLADWVTKQLYTMPFVGWDVLSTLSLLVFLALLFPLVATFGAQVVPQHLLAEAMPSKRWRAVTAVTAMGLLYLFAYGEVALFFSGAIVAIPLVYAFFHWLRIGSPTRAYLVTAAVHGVANAVIILFRGFFGSV